MYCSIENLKDTVQYNAEEKKRIVAETTTGQRRMDKVREHAYVTQYVTALTLEENTRCDMTGG